MKKRWVEVGEELLMKGCCGIKLKGERGVRKVEVGGKKMM